MKKRIVLVLMLVCVLVLVGCSNSNNDDYGALESENEALASQCEIYIRRLEDYKAKMPLRAKYRLGEKVICVVKDKVIKGIVRAVILYENEVAEYQVEVINNKDKTMSNTITILEGYVYPGNTLDVGGKNDK